MTVTPLFGSAAPALDADAPLGAAPPPQAAASSFAGSLADAIAGAGESLSRADAAEHAFASGRGGLQEMMLERAQADVALSVASAAASRAAQALTTILGMQV
jgi:flagellar hook-basal body complex protein FliE